MSPASPRANHSPALLATSYAKHKDPGAALNMADGARIPEALGIRKFWFGAATRQKTERGDLKSACDALKEVWGVCLCMWGGG